MHAKPHYDPMHWATLHRRLVEGDVPACDEICRGLLPIITSWLSRRMPTVDVAIIEEAIEDELLKYINAPELYEPSRAPLDKYIALGATQNVRDALRRVQRRFRHESSVGDDLPDVPTETAPGVRRWSELRTVLKAGKTESERAFLHSRLRGECRTSVLAKILGVEHLSVGTQREEVHRTWVRVRTRIRRACALGAPRRSE